MHLMLALLCAGSASAISSGAFAADASAGSAASAGTSPAPGAAAGSASGAMSGSAAKAANAANAANNAAGNATGSTANNAASGGANNTASGAPNAAAVNAPTSAVSGTSGTSGTSGAGTPATPKSEAAATASAPSAPAAAASTTSAAPTAPAASNAPPTPFQPSAQIRYGNAAMFRNLIPSSMLEAQAAEEFDQIVRGASHANRLYAPTDARVMRVRTITDRLIPYSLKWSDHTKHWKWDIAVIRSPDIRMYCLPGGKIVVYSGMLDRVKLNDNELGMLLGHEIAHALREHARERLGEQQATQLGSGPIPQLFGLADLGHSPLGIGSQLLDMKYERADETEADVIGSEIASRGGYDPRAAVTLWDKLASATRGNRAQGFIYVHPYTSARRQDIVKRLSDMLPLYAKAIGETVDTLPDYQGAGRQRRTTARE
ncbi:M48 family metallopeptidase [Paraburkholderia solisilvae]|nr:M48 family metallopeptidase [Paraburkholderia solisilvae]